MKSVFLLSYVLFLMISCEKKECDCAAIFADDDSVVSVAVSGDDEMNKLITEHYQYKWQSLTLEARANDMNASPAELMTFTEQDWIDFQERYTALKSESEIARLNAKRTQLQLEMGNFDKKNDLQPYTGSCVMKTKNGASDSLRAEFENGVIVGHWLPVQ